METIEISTKRGERCEPKDESTRACKSESKGCCGSKVKVTNQQDTAKDQTLGEAGDSVAGPLSVAEEATDAGGCDGYTGSGGSELVDNSCCSSTPPPMVPVESGGKITTSCGSSEPARCCPSMTTTTPTCANESTSCCKPLDRVNAIGGVQRTGCRSSTPEIRPSASKSCCTPSIPLPKDKSCSSREKKISAASDIEHPPEVTDGCCSSVKSPCCAPKATPAAKPTTRCSKDADAATSEVKEEQSEDEPEACCDTAITQDCAAPDPSTTRLEPDSKGCCSSGNKAEACCSSGVQKRQSLYKSPATTELSSQKCRAARREIQQEPVCPCCVESMLKSNLNVLDILVSRVAEAQSRFKRCCIAFADMCCANSRTVTGCCESNCDGTTEKLPLLSSKSNEQPIYGESDHEKSEVDNVAILPSIGGVAHDDTVLEVIGMDCPDCLSKVTGAVRILAGAEVTNADGVRGLVNVRYDPDRIDLKAIQTFAARASGFTINILDAVSIEAGKTLLLPLAFERMPPASLLEAYEIHPITTPNSAQRWVAGALNPPSKWFDTRSPSGEVELILRLNSSTGVKPRDIVKQLAPYGVSLRRHREDKNHKRINQDLISISLRTLASLALTIPILVLVWSPTQLTANTTSQSIQLALATMIVVVAWPVYSGSFRSAYYLHRADLGVLTSFSTLTSYIFSVVAFGFEMAGRDIGEPFFETVGLLITLIFAGRTLQASTRKLGLQAVGSLGRLQPEQARLITAQTNREEQIDVRLLHYDDVLRVNEGEIVPTDGVVLQGHGTVDESSLTGESMPVTKSRGSTMTAGTTLSQGSIDMIVTCLVPENSISTIMDAVSSSSTGSEYQDLADRMAGWLLPIAGVCCLAAFIGWMLIERFRRGQGWGEAVISGVGYAIAIAAVSCPCALAIAVTLVTSISMATTVNEGVLFRSVQALLTARSIKAIAFDKTGTLSQGVMAVHSTSYDPEPQSVRLIHAITASNKHPVSGTARRYLESQHPELKSGFLIDSSASKPSNELADIEVIPGRGVSANFFGFEIKAGNAKFTNTESHPLVDEYLRNGMTILVITLGQQLIGLFGMKDQPRPGVLQLVSDLGRDGRQISLVSGDNPSAVHAFARGVGIDPTHVYASQTPASKAKVVESLQQACSPGKVAFVGDGINDIIALSTSDISIATGSASNASSQIIILSNDVPKAMRSVLATSRLTRNHVVASLVFCGVYFTVAILLASGVTGWRIPPAYAGLGELVSILPVLLVGAHLAVFKSIARKLVAA